MDLTGAFVFHALFCNAPRLSKNDAAMSTDRAAGELEGARPASSTIRRRPKKAETQPFSGYRIWADAKMRGGRSAGKKSARTFLTSCGTGPLQNENFAAVPLSALKGKRNREAVENVATNLSVFA